MAKELKDVQGDRLEDVDVSRVKPSKTNPRQVFDPAALADLKESIRVRGVRERITIRPIADRYYELVHGERRWRCAVDLGLKKIPSIVRNMTDLDAHADQLISFLESAAISQLEEARALESFRTIQGLSVAQVCEITGLSRTTVQSRRRLLQLGETGAGLVMTGKLPPSHGTLVAALSPQEQAKALELIMEEDEAVSFTRAEEIVRQIRGPQPARMSEPPSGGRAKRAKVPPEVAAFRAATRAAAPALVFAEIVTAGDLLHGAPRAGVTAIEILKLSAGDNVEQELRRADPGEAGLVALELTIRRRAGTSERDLAERMRHATKRLKG